jgi:hypothetical protein
VRAIAYYILQQTDHQGARIRLRAQSAVGRDLKGKLSPLFYIAGIVASQFATWIVWLVTSAPRCCGSFPTGASSTSSIHDARRGLSAMRLARPVDGRVEVEAVLLRAVQAHRPRRMGSESYRVEVEPPDPGEGESEP